MRREWPEINYERWRATCDTLHAHTQTLGKLAVALAPPEPQLQHAALRLTARGWETPPLPAPGGAGAIVVALDLRTHAAVVEHSGGRQWRIPLMPDRAVGAVAQEVLQAVGEVAGVVEINLTTQEVWWSVALDEDTEHARYDADAVASYFAAATSAALVLGEYRAAYRGRSTPVNAWWGSFDLAVNLFSGAPADPPSDDLITRNAMDAEEIAVGWWPGDPGHGTAALYAYAHPAPDRLSVAPLSPEAAYWDEGLGEYLLEWDEVVRSGDPHRYALDFAQSAFDGFFAACGWDPWLWGVCTALLHRSDELLPSHGIRPDHPREHREPNRLGVGLTPRGGYGVTYDGLGRGGISDGLGGSDGVDCPHRANSGENKWSYAT